MSKYIDGKFIIEDYDKQKPFASFLPGIAGVNGIPMWVYYCNRGQGIAGFGVENKNGGIFDFVPANVAYKRTELQGFRTFIKVNNEVHEIFSTISNDDVKREMQIETNGVGFVEVNHTLGMTIKVRYYTVTDDFYPGLVREVTIVNNTNNPIDVELLDGLTTVWPYKNEDIMIKTMSNLAVAWFEVYEKSGSYFFKNRSTTNDSATVGVVDAGHFYSSYHNNESLKVIYDPDLIFGENTGLIKATEFANKTAKALLETTQISANKIPCAFTINAFELVDEYKQHSVVGKLSHMDQLEELSDLYCDDYFVHQSDKAFELGDALTKDVEGTTNYPLFDAYVKQSYLDNFLRGGYPLVFDGKDGPIVYHVYSRIHGDMEREYNDFYVEPAYYSHGIGAFRDVNQNRRNDVFFEKEAGLFNVIQFVELIQVDGNNPLSIRGSKLLIASEDISVILKEVKDKNQVVETILKGEFTPGGLLKAIDDHHIELLLTKDEFVTLVMSVSKQENQAGYGHGFWIDHWTYNMDLIDNYQAVFPDKMETLVYNTPIKSFVSPELVRNRNQKTVLTEDGKVRQYDALYRDEKRNDQFKITGDTCWQKRKNLDLYESNIAVKLLTLIMNKATNFDPSGLGIMMNSDKPGWNDAMNGLPGLFGSGMSEVVELKRVVDFLMSMNHQFSNELSVPSDLYELIEGYMKIKQTDFDSQTKWHKIQNIKEIYLEDVAYGVSNTNHVMPSDKLTLVLELILNQINDSVKEGLAINNNVLPTFIVHDAIEYDQLETRHPKNNLPNVLVKKWSMRLLPDYLEAPARHLKQLKDVSHAKEIYKTIKAGEMYDEKLKMYVTSASLEDESLEIGRARAFTAGWLERESVFMHMSYKYLLGLLKSGLHDEFYESIESALPPFMDAKVYGRSVLENSSFIASSRNPNPSNHGRGFVSRLTGTTSEMISMWLHMMTGTKMFKMNDELEFKLNPTLKKSFFKDNQISFKLFKETTIVYLNPGQMDTFGLDGAKPYHYELFYREGKRVLTNHVIGKDALAIRDGEVEKIIVLLQ